MTKRVHTIRVKQRKGKALKIQTRVEQPWPMNYEAY